MDRQALLENFVTATRGKGQALRAAKTCSYFPPGRHPGCAIGSQPGFREQFEPIMEDSEPIADWLNGITGSDDIGKQLIAFFEVDNHASDVAFLSDLQSLHDDSDWLSDGHLKQSDVDDFCSEHNLAEVTA